MYGLARGIATLIGAAVAALLLWLSTQIEAATTAGYWSFLGLVAAAGLVLALSQVVGGWTKWGMPRVSLGVLLIGFLPALLAGGWFLLASQPAGSQFQASADRWAADVGLAGLFETLAAVMPAVAFGLGLLLGLVLDTAGPPVVADQERREPVERAPAPAERVEDEPVTAERTAVTDLEEEERIEEEYRQPDRDLVRSLSERGGDGDVEGREHGQPPPVDESRTERRSFRLFGR